MRPIHPDDLSQMIGAIYDCALDPALWPDALDMLCDVLAYRVAGLALQETRTWRILLDVSGGPKLERADLERMRAYGPDVIDHWGGAERVMSLPLETPLLLFSANPRAAESRYSREWAHPLGIVDAMAVGFSRDSDSVSSLGLARHADDGPLGADDVEALRLFIPHLKRSLAISRLLDARAVRTSEFAAVLDALSVAVLLVRADLRLIHSNRAGEALLRTGAPLGLRHGRLTSQDGLGAALAAALAVPADRIGRRGLGIPARRADGEELVLHILPLGGTNPLAGATAAIFVAPAVTPRPPPLAAVAALFDLTPAETGVLDLVGAGRTNAEIAASLGVAVSTVRTHLLRLFEKTGTHRQADLAALLASFSLPIG